jgi:hypothetical protein
VKKVRRPASLDLSVGGRQIELLALLATWICSAVRVVVDIALTISTYLGRPGLTARVAAGIAAAKQIDRMAVSAPRHRDDVDR